MTEHELPFYKVEAIGNDFPLIHNEVIDPSLLPELAIAICDRRFGVGGDGLLTLENAGEGTLNMRMFNPDGTEDFCGNGLRCAAYHGHKMGWVGNEFTIHHLDRDVECRIEGSWIHTTMPPATYFPSSIPYLPYDPACQDAFDLDPLWRSDDGLEFRGSALSTGSTHTVFSWIPDEADFLSLSPRIEVAEVYPQRTSIIWREETGPMKLRIRIWERGVGETLGCGTGSSAAAIDYLRHQRKGGTVEVTNPGGMITVTAETWNAPFTIVGHAHESFQGTYFFRTASS